MLTLDAVQAPPPNHPMHHLPCPAVLLGASLLLATAPAAPAGGPEALHAQVEAEYPSLETLYRYLHQHPELSFHETNTARRVGEEWERAGFTVTRGVGGHGIVGQLTNGPGPTVLLRTDLDGLPVKEQTGLPYASTVRTPDGQGNAVEAMHACGHDIHMTCLTGAARVLARTRDRWQGTVLLVGQPAEERGGGARAMIRDGLFSRFPKPDYGFALHCSASLLTGSVGWVEGYALANVDSVDVTIRGVGGHGAYPHTTKDPVVLAAQTVLALQTIVSREVTPGEPAVITVGSIHGGAKHNIIPEEVKLQLTLRSYNDAVREQQIAAIRRITQGLAAAAGLPEDRYPLVTVADEHTPATYNDPALTRKLAVALRACLGEELVVPQRPVMGGEDFGEFSRTTEKIPCAMFWLGAVSPEANRASLASGRPLPSLHSPFFAPAPEPTIKTGVTTLVAAVLELAKR